MKPQNPGNAPAVSALLKFNTYANGAFEPEGLGGLTTQEFEAALDAGLLFRPSVRTMSHDDIMQSIVELLARYSPRSYTDAFLASLSTHRHEFRAGLPAYASLHRLEAHAHARPDVGNYCTTCGLESDENSIHRNFLNRVRFEVGGLVGVDVATAMFHLEEHARLPKASPAPADVAIFSQILEVLASVPADGTVKKHVSQQIAKIPGFPSTPDSRQALLETLGYCGILETPEHGGMIQRFVRLAVAPKKRHSSDWQYPVDFWTGADGLNRTALSFWFGCYPELAEWTS